MKEKTGRPLRVGVVVAIEIDAVLERYGAPGGRQEAACAAALEYTYHHSAGHRIRLRAVARRYGAPERLCAVIARRLKRLSLPAAYGESEHDGGESHELH